MNRYNRVKTYFSKPQNIILLLFGIVLTFSTVAPIIAIVKDTPGVTRDRIYADVSWLDYNFTIIDTGGIEPESDNIILKSMREQAEIAIETADVIIFMTDVRQGLVDDDYKVVQMLRKSKKPVILVVDHYVPTFDKDAGSKTTYQYLKMFVKMGYSVKFLGDNFLHEEPYTRRLNSLSPPQYSRI